jgi:hypothetical protein
MEPRVISLLTHPVKLLAVTSLVIPEPVLIRVVKAHRRSLVLLTDLLLGELLVLLEVAVEVVHVLPRAFEEALVVDLAL